jgi:hypothetical protein
MSDADDPILENDMNNPEFSSDESAALRGLTPPDAAPPGPHNTDVAGTWITFRVAGRSDSGRTAVWRILPKGEQGGIGDVRWYAPWRRYCLMPFGNTVFEEKCLREIATFCEDRTKEHRAASAARKDGIHV